ncbi:MAG: tRNA pseudouridine(38-40) synthase TruA [Nitrospinales bacterium]
MRKIKIVLEYDGSAYSGWQRQPNGTTIQEVLEQRLRTITGKKTAVVGSGRTDAGVHAEAQTAHFTTSSAMTGRQFLKALNSLLPGDITVRQVEEVAEDFNARRSAARKRYRYTILNRDYPSALHRGRVWFIPHALNLAAMRRAARHLLGEHDFSAFRAANTSNRNAVRELFRIDLKKDGDFIHLTLEGSGFLKHMVRIVVGTLVEVGRGRMSAKQVKDILDSRDRIRAGPTAPPLGLCLVEVTYPAKKPARREKKSSKK